MILKKSVTFFVWDEINLLFWKQVGKGKETFYKWYFRMIKELMKGRGKLLFRSSKAKK